MKAVDAQVEKELLKRQIFHQKKNIWHDRQKDKAVYTPRPSIHVRLERAQMGEIQHQLDGATNVLLKEPPIGQSREECTSLLLEDSSNPSVLFVTYTRQASDCVAQIGDAAVSNLGVITVGDSTPDIDRDDVATENISTASDLTGLGIEIGQYLTQWNEPVVCFDSLTSLLQYVDFETAYEFLHAITGQIHATGARAHFHIDPSAHDEKQVAGITSLFDASVSLNDEVTVRTREIIE